jgi:epoxide hydrolase-like predicted phosphatase
MSDLSAAIRSLLGAEAEGSPMHGLERGELSVTEFERHLASRLRRADGSEIQAAGLLTRAFAAMRPETGMVAAVRAAKSQSVRTGLLSNSWGLDYDRAGWDELFDAVVISGEVGLRKPEPAIYRLAADRLGMRPDECVFVDDIAANVRAAVDAGMVGVHHTSVESTIAELEVLLGVSLGVGDR